MEDTRTTAARTHFDRWSETYERDSAARWLREVQTAALAALALNANDVLLDLGSGTGAAVRDAAPHVRRAVGFDLSPGMIAEARDRAQAEGLGTRVEFIVGDVSGPLPFDDAAFTAILCTTAFHHFPRPRDTIGQMSRVLAPGGRLVIADANRRHPAVFALDLANDAGPQMAVLRIDIVERRHRLDDMSIGVYAAHCFLKGLSCGPTLAAMAARVQCERPHTREAGDFRA